MLHALLKRYCTEEELTQAYEKVTRSSQRVSESEEALNDGLQDDAVTCKSLFSEHDLTHNFLKGLSPDTRPLSSEAILQRMDMLEFPTVQRMEGSSGTTHRAYVSSSTGSGLSVPKGYLSHLCRKAPTKIMKISLQIELNGGRSLLESKDWRKEMILLSLVSTVPWFWIVFGVIRMKSEFRQKSCFEHKRCRYCPTHAGWRRIRYWPKLFPMDKTQLTCPRSFALKLVLWWRYFTARGDNQVEWPVCPLIYT